METHDLEVKATTMLAMAAEFKIATQAEYESGVAAIRDIKGLVDQINSTFDEPVKQAHAAHKAILAARDKHLKPLQEAERLIRGKGSKYLADLEVERMRLQREAEDKARREAEAAREAERKRLWAEGQRKEAKAVAAAPIVVAPVAPVAAPAPEVKGVAVRKTWRYRIVDKSKIRHEFLIPDETAIRKTVTSLGADAAGVVGGIECYEETGMAVKK